MILCAALSNTNFPTWPACFDGVFGVRNYIAKLQEKEISVSKSFPFSEMNSIQLNFDDVLKKIVGKEYKSNSFAAPIITVLLICYLIINYICLFNYLFISSQMSAKPYFIGSTGILPLW